MTLEAKLDALTAAIDKLSVALTPVALTPAALTPVALTPVALTPVAPPPALIYEDVKVPFLALVKKNRDLALAVLKDFGLDSLKAAKPEQFATILTALNNALAS